MRKIVAAAFALEQPGKAELARREKWKQER